MASKKTIIEELITLPWWFNLILAAVTYAFLKYWIPSIEFQSPLFSGVARALPNLVWILSTLLIFTALISAFHSWRKGELIGRQTSVQSIQNLSWKEFEYLVSEAYRRQGFQVTENYRSGPDGGVDLTLSKGTDKILVQCKNWKLNKVGVQVILELFGIVTSERATKGVVVCSNSFTKEATEFATRNNIELITGSALRKMVASVQDTPKIESSSKRSDCPVCGSHMIYRVAKKGSKTGKGFLGCSRFPACRGTRNQQI